jgi:hypothetical protein
MVRNTPHSVLCKKYLTHKTIPVGSEQPEFGFKTRSGHGHGITVTVTVTGSGVTVIHSDEYFIKKQPQSSGMAHYCLKRIKKSLCLANVMRFVVPRLTWRTGTFHQCAMHMSAQTPRIPVKIFIFPTILFFNKLCKNPSFTQLEKKIQCKHGQR